MNDEMGKSRWVAPSYYLSSFLILTLISVLLTLFLSTYLHNPEYETIEDSEAKVIARSKQARKKPIYTNFSTIFCRVQVCSQESQVVLNKIAKIINDGPDNLQVNPPDSNQQTATERNTSMMPF